MSEPTERDAVLATDAGSWLAWQPEAFAQVQDYESWSRELEEPDDLLRHVNAGSAVPVSIGSDGAHSFRVRVGRRRGRLRGPTLVDLTERERRYTFVSSEPYLLVSHGRVVVSGIEHVGPPDPARQLALDVPAGRWVVTAHVIEWDAEPGSKDDAGRPTPQALPDFVLLLNPENGSPTTYRRSLVTFEAG